MWNKTKQSLKSVLDIVWSIRKPRYQNRIVYYHSVHPTTVDSHTPKLFEKQLLWLKKKGFRSVLIRDIPSLKMNNIKQDARPWIAITFDDGYQDNVQYALPILVKLGFKATFFVVAGMVRNGEVADSSKGYNLYPRHPMMNVQDLKTLISAGMEVGSHTASHHAVTRVLSRSKESTINELKESKKILETMIGSQISSFSYPNGQRGAFSRETRALLAAQGYLAACTTMWGTVKSDTDILELPRCEMASTDSLDRYVASISSQRGYLKYVHRMFDRSKSWPE